jgi:hypothetical protein
LSTYRYSSPWDFKEHLEALRAVSAVALRRRPWLRALRLAFPLFLIALVFGPPWLRGELEFNSVVFISALPWVLLLILWVVFIRWGEFFLAARRTRRLDPSANGILTRTLSEEGFRIDGTGQSGELRWEGIHSVVETTDFLLVFYNRLCAYYVPKRLILTRGEFEGLRSLLRAKLGDRAQVWASHMGRAA